MRQLPTWDERGFRDDHIRQMTIFIQEYRSLSWGYENKERRPIEDGRLVSATKLEANVCRREQVVHRLPIKYT